MRPESIFPRPGEYGGGVRSVPDDLRDLMRSLQGDPMADFYQIGDPRLAACNSGGPMRIERPYPSLGRSLVNLWVRIAAWFLDQTGEEANTIPPCFVAFYADRPALIYTAVSLCLNRVCLPGVKNRANAGFRILN